MRVIATLTLTINLVVVGMLATLPTSSPACWPPASVAPSPGWGLRPFPNDNPATLIGGD